jgi:DNA-directed RNA polymerase specialized sigma24 family protein
VERHDHIDELPPAYAVAIRLHQAGTTDDVIALGLGVEPDAVPTLLDVARRKLADLSDRTDPRQT